MPGHAERLGPAGVDGERFDAAIAAIDAVNAQDPESVVVDGVERPKELVHSEAMTSWVHRLVADPSEVQLLAARAHHLRRWTVPRADYPEGRAGYLRWRRDQQRRHADEVGEILSGLGYDDATVAQVGSVVRKEGLAERAEVQTHEDALCLVFLQEQAAAVAGDLGEQRTVRILERTAAKMSDRAVAEAVALDLHPEVHRLLEAALAERDRTQ